MAWEGILSDGFEVVDFVILQTATRPDFNKGSSQRPLQPFQRLRQLFGDLGLYNCAAIVPAAVPATVPAEARRAVRGNVRQLRLSRRQRGRAVGKRGGWSEPPMHVVGGHWQVVSGKRQVASAMWYVVSGPWQVASSQW